MTSPYLKRSILSLKLLSPFSQSFDLSRYHISSLVLCRKVLLALFLSSLRRRANLCLSASSERLCSAAKIRVRTIFSSRSVSNVCLSAGAVVAFRAWNDVGSSESYWASFPLIMDWLPRFWLPEHDNDTSGWKPLLNSSVGIVGIQRGWLASCFCDCGWDIWQDGCWLTVVRLFFGAGSVGEHPCQWLRTCLATMPGLTAHLTLRIVESDILGDDNLENELRFWSWA